MTQQPIPNPHDGFFKATFSRLEVVQLALRHFLSPDVRGCLKLETLKLDKDSFVDDELRQTFSDLVFQAETVTEHRRVFVFCWNTKVPPIR